MSLKKRNTNLDGMKLFLMFSVVLLHMDNVECGFDFRKMIASYTMPAFAFLSGYFSSDKNGSSIKAKWVLKLLALYFVFQWSQCVFKLVVPYLVTGTWGFVSMSNWTGFVPCFALWYLIALIAWRLLLAAWGGGMRNSPDVVLLCLSFGCAILSGFVPLDLELSFQRIFVFFPVILLGYMTKKYHLEDIIGKIPLAIAIVFVVAGCALSLVMPVFNPSSPYDHANPDMLLRTAQLLLGCCISLALFRIFNAINMGQVAKLGRQTLWIYLFHTLLISAQAIVFSHFKLQITLPVAGLIAIFYVFGIALIAETFSVHMLRRSHL